MLKPVSRLSPSARARLRTRAGARAWKAAWLAWLMLALLVVPALGRVHQALHSSAHLAYLAPLVGWAGAGGADAHPASHATRANPQGLAAPGAATSLSALVPTHASGADCLLLDQLALADVLLAHAQGVPAVHRSHGAPVQWTQHAFVLHRALFQARAPPSSLRA